MLRRRRWLCMVRLKGVVSLALGTIVLALVGYNAEFGLYQTHGDGIMHKLVLTHALAGGCSEAMIRAALDAHGASPCIEPIGLWNSGDIMIAMIAGSLMLRGARKMDFLGMREATVRSRARWAVRIGFLLIGLGLADWMGTLSGGHGPVEPSLFGGELPAHLFGALAVSFGSLAVVLGLQMRKSPVDSDGVSIWGDWEGWDDDGSQDGRSRRQRRRGRRVASRALRGPAESRGAVSVGDLRSALGLQAVEDPFGQDDGFSDLGLAGRTCHYCAGQGCANCGNTGMI